MLAGNGCEQPGGGQSTEPTGRWEGDRGRHSDLGRPADVSPDPRRAGKDARDDLVEWARSHEMGLPVTVSSAASARASRRMFATRSPYRR